MKWIDKVILEQDIFRCDASNGNLRVPTHPKREIAGQRRDYEAHYHPLNARPCLFGPDILWERGGIALI